MTPEERKARMREYQAKYRENNKEMLRVKARERYHANITAGFTPKRSPIPKEVRNDYQRKARARLRAEVYAHYGAYCACCGEREQKFLTIDHVNGDGKEHRKSAGGVLGALYDIRRRGFPPDYQVLCFNCNCGRQQNGGICPHKI